VSRPGRASLALLATVALLGCRDLERFDTADGEAYCGQLVPAPFQTGFLPDDAEPAEFGMRLEFDIRGLAHNPGTLSTDDDEQGICAPSPLFDETRMRSVSEAFHDPISALEFGDGRERNVLFWADSSCSGTLLGVLSLMRDDSIEVRLFKPAPEPSLDTPSAERPGFAEFHLTRRRGDCGF
jgi:hypothetical protein